MIGFILGTSEGRKILSLINRYTENIAVSTATSYGGQLLQNFKIKSLNTKPLKKDEFLDWMKDNNIKLLVDGSHPYAKEITQNAIECAEKLNVDYIRYERCGVLESIQSENIIRVSDYDEALKYLKKVDGNILNTTGGNNAVKFAGIDFQHRIIHRVLPSVNVLSKLIESGIKIKDIVAMQGPISCELEMGFIKQFDIKAIITKDSGIEGGCLEKFKAVHNLGIKLIVIEKPKFEYDIQFNEEETLIEYIKENYSHLF
ncbi:cobalt-precorrin-6A reductase [uncultured Clostridium sp.]|uniref:cobalt-precorrin-6A reductase n=1 Tax=uncultured Clostridium sp. TaxID=59620 RepID=UPI0025F47955|nr:cobalt-precorrin-6A reductase [uncultured Clostridium sp.]